MVDDYGKIGVEIEDKHSCGQCEAPKIESDDCYIYPPNILTMFWRLPELWTDPSSNQLSSSRLVLFLMACCVVALTWAAILAGQFGVVTTMIAAVAASAAGVYFASQFKDLRWKKREKD